VKEFHEAIGAEGMSKKMFRMKIFLVGALFALLLALAACGDNGSLVGRWEMVDITGADLSAEELAIIREEMAGYSLEFEFLEDHTGSWTDAYMGDTFTDFFTWSVDSDGLTLVYADGLEYVIEYALSGSRLTFFGPEGEGDLVFRRVR